MLMIRETPKISDNPTATKNRPEAVESPLSAWNRNALKVMRQSPLPDRGEVSEGRRARKPQFVSAGRNFLTSASLGNTDAPSTYLKSVIVPLPFSSAILPT